MLGCPCCSAPLALGRLPRPFDMPIDLSLRAGLRGPPEPGPGQLAVDSCATYDSGRPFGSLSRSGMTADEFRKCLHRGAGGRVYDERPVLWYPLDWPVLASLGGEVPIRPQ